MLSQSPLPQPQLALHCSYSPPDWEPLLQWLLPYVHVEVFPEAEIEIGREADINLQYSDEWGHYRHAALELLSEGNLQ